MSIPTTPKTERRAACAAVDAMAIAPVEGDAHARRHGMRPLKPPPVRGPAPAVRTAGAAALARDIRLGAYDPRGPRLGE